MNTLRCAAALLLLGVVTAVETEGFVFEDGDLDVLDSENPTTFRFDNEISVTEDIEELDVKEQQVVIRFRSAALAHQPSGSARTAGSLTLTFEYDEKVVFEHGVYKIVKRNIVNPRHNIGHVELSAGVLKELPVAMYNSWEGVKGVAIKYRPHGDAAAAWKLDTIRIILPDGVELCAKEKVLSAAEDVEVSTENACLTAVIEVRSAGRAHQPSGLSSTTGQPYLQLQYKSGIPLTTMLSRADRVKFAAGEELAVTQHLPFYMTGLTGVVVGRYWSSAPWKLSRVFVQLTNVEGGHEQFCGRDLTLAKGMEGSEEHLKRGHC